ncbi:MAG: Sir2 family NAD-dependent protein deacetylase [Anaerolineae bacterium]|nr:Sir2 family NAD-dependent protein deacetylase [Anaerolineae bacterium]
MDEGLIDRQLVEVAAFKLLKARRGIAFTGAGISVESGIPPFRGPGGLWNHYDPSFIELNFFRRHPSSAWGMIKEVFYDHFGKAKPNAAHRGLAWLEQEGLISGVITQNIDRLHQQAGSRNVIEFHGSNQYLVCLRCGERMLATEQILENLPPLCPVCGEVLKPDFVFFSEGIPEHAFERSLDETMLSDVWIVIGTMGEVMPACSMPIQAKRNGATIIEINIQPSEFTDAITDIFLRCPASVGVRALKHVILDLRDEGLDQ